MGKWTRHDRLCCDPVGPDHGQALVGSVAGHCQRVKVAVCGQWNRGPSVGGHSNDRQAFVVPKPCREQGAGESVFKVFPPTPNKENMRLHSYFFILFLATEGLSCCPGLPAYMTRMWLLQLWDKQRALLAGHL